MKLEQATGEIKLIGERTVKVDALFDTGAVESVMSLDLAKEIGRFSELPERDKYTIPTANRNADIRIIGKSSAPVEFDGCNIPSTTFEVSPDLPEKR